MTEVLTSPAGRAKLLAVRLRFHRRWCGHAPLAAREAVWREPMTYSHRWKESDK